MKNAIRPAKTPSIPLFYLARDIESVTRSRPLWTDWCDLSWFEVITLGVTFGAILAFLLYSVRW